MPSLLAACFAVAVVLSSQPFAHGQTCAASTQMSFKKVADPNGIRSYINAPGTTVPYTVGIAMPPVVVQFIALDSNRLSLGYDFSLDGVTAEATVFPALILGGSAVLVNRGEAIFSALILQEVSSTTSPSNLTFTITTPAGKKLSLSTGPLVAVPISAYNSPASVQFANSGYFLRDGLGRDVPYQVPLPQFSLEVLNSIGIVIPVSGATVTVSATPSGAVVVPNVFSSLTISNLTINDTATSTTVTLRFTVSFGGWSASTKTGSLNVLGSNGTGLVRNQFMLFDNTSASFITAENQGNTAVLGVALPSVIIKLYNSFMQLDTSDTGLIITATCNQATLSGAEALVVNGVATFAELTFVDVAPAAAVIIFVAGAQGGLAVAGATLSSGALAVSTTAVKAKHIRFSAFTDLAGGTTSRSVVMDSSGVFTLPLVNVQLMDSAYRPDPLANGVAVTISVYPTSAATPTNPSALTVMSADGMAIFRGLQFTAAADSMQFLLTSGDRVQLLTAPVLPKTNPLTTASASSLLAACEMVVAGASTCRFSLRFASTYGSYTSLIYQNEQQSFTTVGATLATIVVELVDEFGVVTAMPDLQAPVLVAYTGSDPLTSNILVTTNNANHGTYLAGRYYFSCLQFASAPSGLVRIQFMPMTSAGNTATSYVGIIPSGALRTGFITVAAVTSPNYGVRFSTSTATLISYEGQRSSAALRVALPPINLEFVDSLNNLDTSDSSSSIVVSTSTGQLDNDGTTVQVVNGQASFSNIRFTSLSGQVPSLTFTVVGSAALGPVVGNTLTTGSLYVSALPVSAFELAFHPQTLANNNVTSNFASFTFNNLTDVSINLVIIVRDSSHQRARGLGALGITVTPSSDEVVLASTAPVALDPACDCVNFTVRFSSYRGAYLPAYVAFTASAGPQKLIGKSAVLGPVIVLGAASSSTCASNVRTPAVIGEFRITQDIFKRTNMDTQIAELLGIGRDRVLIANTSIINRVNHSTLEAWTGTKAIIKFGDPTSSSTNRKTSAEIAATWVALRPGCDGASIGLQAVYYQKDDHSCDPEQFKASLAATVSCATNSDLCQCYASIVVPDWALVCAEEKSLQADLLKMCNTISGCGQTEIKSLCDTIIVSQPVNLVWLWGTLGGIGGLAMIGAGLHFGGFLRSKPKVLLDVAIAD